MTAEGPDEPDVSPDTAGGKLIQLRPEAATEVAQPGADAPVPADAPSHAVAYAPAVRLEGERRDIIPVHLQRENIRATVAEFVGLNWHRARWHGFRLPLTLLAVIVWAAVGVLRVAARQVRWAWVLDSLALQSEAVISRNSAEWLRLSRHAREVRKVRGMILGGEAAGIVLAAALLIRLGPVWSWIAAGVPAVLLLARAGRPEGHRIVGQAVVPPRYEVPTPELITEALCELDIPKIRQAVKDKGSLEWVSDVHRDGDGWAVEVDLPKGVTAAMILARRKELSSGLRRPLSATWPEPVPHEHEGRMFLWIGRHDLSKVPPRPYPLLKAGQSDFFAPVPFATNPRGTPVCVPLFQANYLIGAAPGEGKTSTLRMLGLNAALDPVCDLWTHEFSGKGDLRILGQVSHRYCSGLDEESIAYAAESIAMLRDELERRSAIFKKLPDADKPEGALTRGLALDPGLRLRPIVAIFDEIQNLMLSPYGAEAGAMLAYLMRLARAYGIVIILATQRPSKDSLPTDISGIVTMRFCLKVADYLANDMVLGTGAYKAGYNAVAFRHETDAGLGWLRGDADPQAVKTYYLNLRAAGKVAARARAVRERAGVLSGYALGEDESAVPRDVLSDVQAVFGADSGLQWPELADRLAARYPERWASLTAEAISAQCRAHSVRSVDVKSDGVVLKGCRRISVDQAARR